MAYADGVTVIGKSKTAADVSDSLQRLIDVVASWSQTNFLTLNVSKCSTLLVSSKVRQKQNESMRPIKLCGQAIEIVDKMTILDVVLTNNLSWTAHANHVKSKISGRLGVIRRFGPSLNFRSHLQMFNIFIKPSLIYCLPVWGNCSLSCQHIFDTLRLRCTKYV